MKTRNLCSHFFNYTCEEKICCLRNEIQYTYLIESKVINDSCENYQKYKKVSINSLRY